MVLTTGDLERDLQRIDQLIAVMSRPALVDRQDVDDLGWLISKRQALAALLAVRRAQKGQKIVDLELWRVGVARTQTRATAAA